MTVSCAIFSRQRLGCFPHSRLGVWIFFSGSLVSPSQQRVPLCSQRERPAAVLSNQPLLCEFGTNNRVKVRFWPWLQVRQKDCQLFSSCFQRPLSTTPELTRGNRKNRIDEISGELTSKVNSHFLSRSQWCQLLNPNARRRIHGHRGCTPTEAVSEQDEILCTPQKCDQSVSSLV